MNRLKQMFSARRFRAGGYATFAAAVVIAIAVLVNMVVGALPADVTQIDVTSQALYTLSDQSRQIVRALDRDVTLSLLAYTGQEDESVTKLLDRYAALSDHVKVEYVDPAVNPKVLEKYKDEALYANSVIVTCGEKYRFVSYQDIFQTDYSNYYYNGSVETTFNGEGALTSAIHYVASDDLPKVYSLTGHGEKTLSASLEDLVEEDNLELTELSLLSLEQVPEDADCVLIYAPSSDLSADEAQLLTDYLDAGGDVMLITDYIVGGAMPNLMQLTKRMGMQPREGIVVEGDGSRSLRGYAYYLLPYLGTHEITTPISEAGYYLLMPMAQGILETGEGSATVTSLMNTSGKAYAKAAGYDMTTTEQEDGDATGPFDVAMASEDGEAHMVWATSASMLEDGIDQVVSGANGDFFLNALNWMCEQEESISIRAKPLSSETLTLSSRDASLWSAVVVGVVPVALVAVGVVIWFRRKRR